jgi:hypothetical protein
LGEDAKSEAVQLLSPDLIADLVANELMNPQVIDERDFVRKLEWNIYEDFAKVRDSGVKAPTMWSQVNM